PAARPGGRHRRRAARHGGLEIALRHAAAAHRPHRRRAADGPGGGPMSEPRTSDRNVDRVIRSWLHEDRHEDYSRVAGAVLDLLDTTPQRRNPWWPARRFPFMNKFVSLGLGAAAVVVAVVIGAQVLGPPAPGGVGGAPSA